MKQQMDGKVPLVPSTPYLNSYQLISWMISSTNIDFDIIFC